MTPTEKILAIIRSFPCLRGRFGQWRPKEFKPDEFWKGTAGMSHGELLCAQFILNVWNSHYAQAKGWTFDVIEFASVLDYENRLALLQWMANPIWP